MDPNTQDKGKEKGKDWNSRAHAQLIRKKQKLKTQEEKRLIISIFFIKDFEYNIFMYFINSEIV